MSARGASRLSDLLRGAGVRPVTLSGPDPLIRGAALDSRRIAPGDLFFALRGTLQDGVEYVPEAVRRGATAVVSEQPRPAWLAPEIAWVEVEQARRIAGLLSRECHGRPDEALTLVGITGTNGKTTVACLLEAIATAGGLRAGRIGTVGHAFADVRRPSERTTPEAPDFYAMLAEMRDESIDLVSMEVSSHALALHRVEGARFSTAAFLNLSRDHLDFHGTQEAYFAAKARLFESLRPEACAVLPADSPYGEMLGGMTQARVLRFGRAAGAEVRLTREHCGIDGSSAVLETPSGAVPIRTFLLGRFNLDNVAAAAASAIAVGLPIEAVVQGALALRTIPGRMEPVDLGQPYRVIVDYAHTEEALSNLLRWVGEITRGRVLLVFGCGGDRDRGKRPAMGRVAAASGATIFLTSDNPRSEDPQAILDAVAAGIAEVPGAAERCDVIADRREAIGAAVAAAEAGDIVVIAGKGHETTQTIGTRVEPFDDREVAASAVRALGLGGVRGA